MRADMRDLEGNCVPEEELVDQPCGSASSDSNSNGDVKSPKTTAILTPKIQLMKTTSLSAKSSPGSPKTCKCGTKKVRVSMRQKKQLEVVKSKRKAGGEDSIEKTIRSLPNDDDVVSDDEYVPGPSTSNDLDFGYNPTQVVPWATKNYYPLSIDGLHEEIVDCWQWIRPTRLETATRYKVFEKVRDLIQHCWASIGVGVQVSVFGSLRTRLFLPSSDIDILVECMEWTTYTDAQLHTDVMQYTMDYLQHFLDKVSFHPTAFVPILKFSDRDTKLNIDISFNTVQGVKAATYMQQVKTEFPCVEPLLLLLKQYIFQNKMHEAYSGGLSSYGISLMLVNFFTIHYSSYRYVQPETDHVNLGYLLMRFLEVYGHELNYTDVAIDPGFNRYRRRSECLRPPATTGAATAGGSDGGEGGEGETEEEREERVERVAMAEAEGKTRPVLLSVHDPLHEGNEVCRASFNIYAVRTLFQAALVQLRAVFVMDRPGSMVWRKHVYKGTMLGRLLHFSPAQINFRYWLKGFVLSRPEPEATTSNGKATTGLPTLIYGSILSEPSDLSCLLRIPKAGQRVLEIKRPDEVEEKKYEKKKEEEKREEQTYSNTSYVEERPQVRREPIRQMEEAPSQWYTVGRGGRVYNNRGGGGQTYQRDLRYGSNSSANSNIGQSHRDTYYYSNHQQQSQQQQQHHQLQPQATSSHSSTSHSSQSHLQQPRPYNGGYQSKTWERMGGGPGRRFHDDRKKSRSTEGLAEQPFRPRRELTPQLGSTGSSGASGMGGRGGGGGSSSTATTTTLSYKRSDSAVSSCSTTVMGTASSFSTASSSVSSPAINGAAPPPGFSNVHLRNTASPCSPSPSSSSSYLSRNRGDRMSGRGEVYKPPAARKAAEAAAAATGGGGERTASTSTSATSAAASSSGGAVMKKKEPTGVIAKPSDPKSDDEKKWKGG